MKNFNLISTSQFCKKVEEKKIILSNHLLIFPTDTLWGIACLADDEIGIKRIYDLKERDTSKALIALLSHKKHLQNLILTNPIEDTILSKFMYASDEFIGGLSIIFPYNPISTKWKISKTVLKNDSLCIRIPNKKSTKRILATVEKNYGVPLLVTSVNISGDIPATSLNMIIEFLEKLDVQQTRDIIIITDKNKSILKSLNVPSTILSLSTQPPQILRLGALSIEEVEKTLDIKID